MASPSVHGNDIAGQIIGICIATTVRTWPVTASTTAASACTSTPASRHDHPQPHLQQQRPRPDRGRVRPRHHDGRGDRHRGPSQRHRGPPRRRRPVGRADHRRRRSGPCRHRHRGHRQRSSPTTRSSTTRSTSCQQRPGTSASGTTSAPETKRSGSWSPRETGPGPVAAGHLHAITAASAGQCAAPPLMIALRMMRNGGSAPQPTRCAVHRPPCRPLGK